MLITSSGRHHAVAQDNLVGIPPGTLSSHLGDRGVIRSEIEITKQNKLFTSRRQKDKDVSQKRRSLGFRGFRV